ncbi:site-specific DNA-methyltransferase [Mycoplasmatota bacterium]|nr:site-specific DNA-methyltransferase [Mycoplasmatota bacterium]
MNEYRLYNEDCLVQLSKLKKNSIDMIFADPPYFLSSGGITCVGGRMVSVDKADWDKQISNYEKHKFNKQWLRKCKRVLKDNGTVFISGTYHNIYSIGRALEETGFTIINNITWRKTNPPPHLACRYFTHSTETILWAKKSKKAKHYFNYDLMKKLNGGKQMKDVWDFPCINRKEKSFGNHPTQKPLKLLERIVIAATKEGDTILDPFSGSGTTGVAAIKHKRKYVGIDTEKEYIEISKLRLEDVLLKKISETP